jgi:hypothetical protein
MANKHSSLKTIHFQSAVIIIFHYLLFNIQIQAVLVNELLNAHFRLSNAYF